MVARFILPWFGGSSLVWTTCMLFFQSALVFGYAWAHFMNRRFPPNSQWIIHTLLLAAAICFLPIKPSDYWKPLDAGMPTFRILALLAVSVGLPFFLLSMTGPLLQAWQSKTHPDRSPFRLFALSNFASLAALISYPFVFERFMTVESQSWSWSITFGVFAVLAFITGKMFAGRVSEQDWQASRQAEETEKEKIGLARIMMWMILPMLASVQLLATTNLMTQEVGSLPFLWIVPLSLYLISFIICFDHSRWYWRPFFYLLFYASSIAAVLVLEGGVDVPIVMQVIGYSAVCFGVAMCCHGELARSKPGPENLTMFYLLISIGGALGGVFVALVAPRLFDRYYEFQVGIVAAIMFCLVAYGMSLARRRFEDDGIQSQRRSSGKLGFSVALFLGLLTIVLTITSIGTQWVADNKDTVLEKSRNEYGMLTVKEYGGFRKLTNGEIEHGFQYTDELDRNIATSYYGPDSGLGLSINYLAEGLDTETGLDFGVIGLGVGTVCGWCAPPDTIRYYEINPAVEVVARKHFWYLEECRADSTEVVLGDARLQLEREVERDDERRYDVLVADAFSSDSIPMHLLTLESMEIYKKRLKPNGILAFHVSNRFLVLESIVKLLGEEIGMECALVDHSPPRGDRLYNGSSWVLVTRNSGLMDYLDDYPGPEEGRWRLNNWPKESARWTDDFSSIVPVLKIDKDFKWLKELVDEKKTWFKKKKKDSNNPTKNSG